jgi:hypothetical protein
MGDIMHFNAAPKPMAEALSDIGRVLAARKKGDLLPAKMIQSALVADTLARTRFIPETLGRPVTVDEHEDFVRRIAHWAFFYLEKPVSRRRPAARAKRARKKH